MRDIIKSILLLLLSMQTVFIAKEYKGGEYRTIEPVLYGKFEVRYKPPQKDGVLASFFTYFTGSDSVPWTSAEWNEIDIEILGRYDNNVQFNTITPYQLNHVKSNFVDFNPTEDFHVYGFEWTPAYVAWFVDGEEVHRQTGNHIETLIHPQRIMMNIWNPQWENWVGEWDPDVLPAFAYYDWVKYYSYTPGSGNYGTDKNFTHKWTDEFDSFDNTRWSKATHTFFGNQCDFIPDNVIFKDGKLILCLTNSENIGYVDRTPPSILKTRSHKNLVDLFFSEKIDESSAENISSYTISGITIETAELLSDQKTVRLTVSDLDSSKSYNLIALNIKDQWTPQNNMSGKVVPLTVSAPLNFPVKIDIGGDGALDFLADRPWDSSGEYGYLEGEVSDFPSASISLTDMDPIYRSDRRGLVSYRVRVPNGLYNVSLMFAEKYFGTIGNRIFDIHLEGSLIENDFDVLSKVPKNAAYDIVLSNVEVNDEILEVNLSVEKDFSMLSGLIIEQITTGADYQKKMKINNPFELKQNYPNPFNPSTLISYQLNESAQVSITVFDILGNEIERLVNKFHNSGNYKIEFDGSPYSSGIYFYKLMLNGKASETKNMVLIK
jgi:hypothetical protein